MIMIVKVLEIIGGLMLMVGVPYTVLWCMNEYQKKKEYHKDYDKRFEHYMRAKLERAKKEEVGVN